jgi:carboxypeptidase PM20D1
LKYRDEIGGIPIMKKRRLIFGMIGGLLIIFMIVTASNAMLVNSRQPSLQPTEVVINEVKAVEHLSKAITYKTISYQERSNT